MANFVINESSDDFFTLSAAKPSHLSSSNSITLTAVTSLITFTAAQFSGVNFYAVDTANAQRLLNGQSFTGYLLDPNGQYGLGNITLPAGTYYFGAVDNTTLSSTQQVPGFDEVSSISLPGSSFVNNVPVRVDGQAGAYSWQGFTITGSPNVYIETEASGGTFAIMSGSQLQAFQAANPNGCHGGSYTYTYALGGTSGGAATEIEGGLQLSPGSWYLVWINDTAGWAGGAANLTNFGGSGSFSGGAPSPAPSATPSSTQANITDEGGTLVIRDKLSGQLQQTLPDTVNTISFPDHSYYPTLPVAVAHGLNPALLRDFDGNDLGGASGWELKGLADLGRTSPLDYILVNPSIGRFAEVAPQADGGFNFNNHGPGGDTRVVGIYIDPLVADGTNVKGGPFDSQTRFQNDINADRLQVLGAADYNSDGFVDFFFKVQDGHIGHADDVYLRAIMHAGGNIKYANYVSTPQLDQFMQTNNVPLAVYSDWKTL